MPIQILPIQLANQIAAGEVVERPASVVKELVENSLDAGATEVEVDIERGGHKRICIRDNGSGIVKEELELALSRHATSKIIELQDLEAIQSLGFRGEALASISSVSRLTLTSKPQKQAQAWQARAEGRDMQIVVTPSAHPDGTSIDVVDLFFNTPARRKFLRAEKTEFSHIDEVLKRIALSQFDVSILLKHNGKTVRRFPKAISESARKRRLGSIFNDEFAQNAIQLHSKYENMTLTGWLSPPGFSRQQNDQQYVYVNGRVMRDKLINHAIRQAYEGLIESDTHSSYVLYLTIDPKDVDVNVHPAKHEVRFHQSRLVHDFIFRSVSEALNQSFSNESNRRNDEVEVRELAEVEPQHQYIQPLRYVDSSSNQVNIGTNADNTTKSSSGSIERFSKSAPSGSSRTYAPQSGQNYQQLMSAKEQKNDSNSLTGRWLEVGQRQLLINLDSQYFTCCPEVLYRHQIQSILHNSETKQPLLMPVSINLQDLEISNPGHTVEQLNLCGVEASLVNNRFIIKQVPAGLRHLDWSKAINRLLVDLSEESKNNPSHASVVSQDVSQDTHLLYSLTTQTDLSQHCEKHRVQPSEQSEKSDINWFSEALITAVTSVHIAAMYDRTSSYQFLMDWLCTQPNYQQLIRISGRPIPLLAWLEEHKSEKPE